ncbi:uncharacterized protein YgiM (DUF1202 family) [Arthrobacter stackebrandtii]|uniref:Uncharacterized protein YgiM (DUF1202 family) n=1 Tax=Arthrobacter stackebrandtii TaxID=272161 RepID=A0ABS4YSH7_9MICC|nr:hypothetical protein [Arthrobacter stackebrandtii]MBP2411737.1 uncharacterized protein YgiM (DUF1202 family) [Arthrobacter stackebrandtii]
MLRNSGRSLHRQGGAAPAWTWFNQFLAFTAALALTFASLAGLAVNPASADDATGTTASSEAPAEAPVAAKAAAEAAPAAQTAGAEAAPEPAAAEPIPAPAAAPEPVAAEPAPAQAPAPAAAEPEPAPQPVAPAPAAPAPANAPAAPAADAPAPEQVPAPAPKPAPVAVPAPAPAPKLDAAPAPAPDPEPAAAPAPAKAAAKAPSQAKAELQAPAAAPLDAAPSADEQKVVFCHATNSFSNPYKDRIETSLDSFKTGHASHTGPQFPETNADGKWGDIFPPIPGYSATGQNWDFIGQSIWNNNCQTDVPVTPVAPVVVQTECTGPGTQQAPTLQLATTPGITYTINGTVAAGQTVTVIASPNPPEVFKLTAAANWILNTNGTASFSVTFGNPDCIEEALPAAPVLHQGGCAAPGVPVAPTLTMAATEGIVYTVSPAGPYTQGQTVTVTATPAANYTLGSVDGWAPGANGTATKEITFAVNDCIVAVAPLLPTVVQQECTGPGTYTAPSLTWNAVEGITYSNTPTTVTPGVDVVVTATAATGYTLGASDGWTISGDGKTATHTAEFVVKDCTVGVAPEAPVVTKQECTGPGTSTGPSLAWATTDGISYSTIGTVAPGGTVIVKATANPGYKLTAADGWALDGLGSATFTVEFAAADDCLETAIPQAPAVTQEVCTGPGTFSEPTLHLAETDGITYSVSALSPMAGSTVTVTATASEGYELGASAGWDVSEDGKTATLEVEFDAAPDCIDPVTPATPTFTQAECTGPGTASTPTLTVPEDTDTISYTVEGIVAEGETVYITARAAFGHSITAGNGWNLNSDGTATFTAPFIDKDCTVTATPLNPTVENQKCTAPGVSTGPTLTWTAVDGISYSYAGTVAAGNTVTVTASANDGYKLAVPAGSDWSLNPDGTATLTVTFKAAEDCIVPVTPSMPTATQAECTGPGTASTPTLTVPENTDTITYTTEGTIAEGNTVKVVATPAFGHSITLGEGWEAIDGKATFTVEFLVRDCIKPVTPPAPTYEQQDCTAPGTASEATLNVTAVEGISYSYEGTIAAGNTVTVTATPAPGYRLVLPGGAMTFMAAGTWTMNGDGTASFTVTFNEAPDCIVPATPATPTFTQAECTGPGMATTPTLTVPENTDTITYTMEGTIAEGNTVLVIATPAFGHSITLGEGWEVNEGRAVYTATFDTTDCIVQAEPVAPAITRAVCMDASSPVPPTLVLASTKGISYTKEGEVAAVATVVITATPDAGYTLGAVDGWTLNEDGSATLTVTFDIPNCIIGATPQAPVVEQQVCTGPGTSTGPSLAWTTVTGISYSNTGTVAAGNTVTVTATPDDGYELEVLPEPMALADTGNWTLNEDGTASYSVVFAAAPDCIDPASPTAPTFTQAACTAPGVVSDPTLTLPKDSDTIKYTLEGTVAVGKTATVLATPAAGHAVTETDGWTLNEDGTASYTVAFNAAPDCTVEATPAAPGIKQAVCTDGKVTQPAMTLASTKGITYATSGNVANGETVNVTATAASGYSLGKAEGWTANKNGTAATYVVAFDTVNCPAVVVPPAPPAANPAPLAAVIKPAPVVSSPAPLARTGLDAGWNITLSVLFLILGAGAVWRSRRPSNG